MTSFSTYASRFLSTGASATAFTRTAEPQGSFFQPFGSAEYETSQSAALGDGSRDEEEGSENERSEVIDSREKRSAQRRLPHLHGGGNATSKMSSSSRLIARITGQGGRNSNGGMGAIHDMEDELDEDGLDKEHRDHRGRLSILRSGEDSSLLDDQNTPGASLIVRDEHDPFLAEDDLGKSSTRSRSRSPQTQFRRGPSEEAKARGWLAHAADSSSNASTSSLRTPSRRSKRRALPDDVYRDPDQGIEDDNREPKDLSVPLHRGRRDRSARNHSTNRHAFIDNDEEDDTSTASTSDDSGDEDGIAPRRNMRTGAEGTRRLHLNANAAASSLREPLLSSAGSETLSRQPPGAFHGLTSRLASADIYAYPHPPAKSGWTPWAPGNRVPLSQYKDKGALLAWLALCAATLSVAGWMALEAHSTSPPSSPSTRPSPYYTLTRSIPILFLLTFFSVAAAVANLLVLRNISRVGGASIIRNGLIVIPLILIAGWMWAFAGSFIYDDERWSGGGWSTTGLRILSIIPLALTIYFARRMWTRRGYISRSLTVLELSADVVAKHPTLLLLSFTSLAIFIAITAPFLTIFFRLFLRGHFGGTPNGPSNVWHTDSSARLMAWLTLGAWIWTWLVLRGVQRVTVAGVVSHWYFHRENQEVVEGAEGDGKLFDAQDEENSYDETLPGPAPGEWLGEEQAAFSAPTHVDIVRASFIRATGPALGTVCLSALMLSFARVGTIMAATARWSHRKLSASSRIPKFLDPLTHLVALLAGISALLQGLSDFALVYVGVTGDGFAAAARRATRLTTRQSVKTVLESLVIDLLLDLTTLALCFLTGLAGFLISAHNLHVPADAPLVGLLCALVPYGLLRLCADVLSNAADTLYLCFSIDEASGEQHCKQAADAFHSTDERLPF